VYRTYISRKATSTSGVPGSALSFQDMIRRTIEFEMTFTKGENEVVTNN